MGSSTTEGTGQAGRGEGDRAPPSSRHELIETLDEGRRQFLALVDGLRPELHRYCARMTGSIADGEDIVQDTLVRAYYHLPEMQTLPPLRPWLFRIAHNLAIDFFRRESRRTGAPLQDALDVADDVENQPDNALAREQAVQAAISSFLAVAPAQRACVILKDVLDHSLDDIAGLLEMTVPAVKAALHRGRAALYERSKDAPASAPRAVSPALRRYAELFNAHDWDGVRALLADDVRLDLVSRRRIAGGEVGVYFTNYARIDGWHVVPAWLDGREVLAVLRSPQAVRPSYFIELAWAERRVVLIRDFRYVGYIANEAAFELLR